MARMLITPYLIPCLVIAIVFAGIRIASVEVVSFNNISLTESDIIC